MKNHSLDNLIKDLKKITLTSEEKSALFARLNTYADAHEPVRPAQSPYFSYFHISRTLTYSFVSVFALILVITGGAVTRSEKSLPGDVLYHLKVNVAEPLKVAFSPTPEAREVAQVQNIEERLNEAEILAVQGKLAATTSVQIQKSIEDNLSAFNGKLSQQNQEDLDIKLSAHSIVLKSIGDRSNDDQKIHVENIEKSVRKVSTKAKKDDVPVKTPEESAATTTEATTTLAVAKMSAALSSTTETTTTDIAVSTTSTTTVEVISTKELERNKRIEKEVKDIDKKIENRAFKKKR